MVRRNQEEMQIGIVAQIGRGIVYPLGVVIHVCNDAQQAPGFCLWCQSIHDSCACHAPFLVICKGLVIRAGVLVGPCLMTLTKNHCT